MLAAALSTFCSYECIYLGVFLYSHMLLQSLMNMNQNVDPQINIFQHASVCVCLCVCEKSTPLIKHDTRIFYEIAGFTMES